MGNRNKQKKKGRRIGLCWLLAAVMLLTGVNVQAAMFDSQADAFSDGVFTSGEVDGYIDSNGMLTDTIVPEETPIPEVTETPRTTESAGSQEAAGNSEAILSDAEFMDGVTGEEGVSPEELDVFMADGIDAQNTENIRLVFADSAGNEYSDLTLTSKMGSSVILPDVPGYENIPESGWKLEVNVADSDAVILSARSAFALDPSEEYVTEHIKNGVLTFYAVPGVYTVNFYNNSGTGNPLKTMRVSPGSTIKLPDVPNSNYVNFGWTDTPKSTSVKYKIGASYKVNRSVNLYIVRYATTKVKTVTFVSPQGTSNADYRALTVTAVSGSSITLPAIPPRNGYSSLGWSLTANAKSATYAVGKTIKVTRDMTIYAVQKQLPAYTVTFNNNSGTSKSKGYSSLNKTIYRGQYITLPAVPKVSGYQNLGWTTTKKGKTAEYKEGAKVKVTKNMKFYAVRKKAVYYTAEFYSASGSANSTYKALNKKIVSGATITLPSVPSRSGYVNLGWSTKKNASSAAYKEGASLKISKNTKLYAVQKKAVSVVLHQNSGAVWKTYTVAEGASLTLPGAKNKTGYTMMGWSKSSGQKVNPEYEVGETLKNIKGTTHLYAVVFDRRSEADYSAEQLPQADLRKYKQVIFVGDSRTDRMANTLDRLGDTNLTNGISFVCKSGKGLAWFESEGYDALLKKIGDGGQSILEKKTAVIFNLGVNDLKNLYNYVAYMKRIAPELKAKGCVLFYMSVNPVNNAILISNNASARPEATIRNFNAVIKSNLCDTGYYKYINCYNYLIKYGYGTDKNRYGQDEGIDDGLHYTTKTYKRIYRYCMSAISG